MRLFIAVDLPESMMEALAETQAELRARIKGRYCAPNTLHVTLAFLGDVPAARIPDIEDAMRAAAERHEAFGARLGELGHFGKRREATLWQGFADPKPFEELARDLRTELADRGMDFDTKKPKAHITLMRRADLSSGELPMPECEAGRIDVFTLYRSELTQDGPIYTALNTCELLSANPPR